MVSTAATSTKKTQLGFLVAALVVNLFGIYRESDESFTVTAVRANAPRSWTGQIGRAHV